MAVEKHATLYNAINEAITQFGHKNNIDARMHFAQRLRFTGKNGHIQLGSILNTTTYIPANPKPMNIDQMAIILHELDVPERQIVLDAVAKEFGGVFLLDEPPQDVSVKHLEKEIMRTSTYVGKLSETYLDAIDDDEIDDKEIEKMETIVYDADRQIEQMKTMLTMMKKMCLTQ